MIRNVPAFPSLDAYAVDVRLDDRLYRLSLRWDARVAGGSWYASIATVDGAEIVTGRRVAPGADLLAGVVGEDAPPGALLVDGPDPYFREALGRDVTIRYVDAAERAPLPRPVPVRIS